MFFADEEYTQKQNHALWLQLGQFVKAKKKTSTRIREARGEKRKITQ